METVSVQEARKRMGRLLDVVETGEEVIITRRNRPVAKLVPIAEGEGEAPSSFPDRRSFRGALPAARRPSADWVRELRDERG